MRVLFLSNGDVRDPCASSGVASRLFGWLDSTFAAVIPIDVSLTGGRRLFNIVTGFSADRERWRAHLDMNSWAFRRRSDVARRAAHVAQDRFDVVLQMGCMWSPPRTRAPIFMQIDFTNALAQREYRDWAPFRSKAEARAWLAAEREAYARATRIFTTSARVRRSLLADYDVPPEKVHVVGSGGNIEPPANLEKHYDRRTALFVGRDFRRKGGEVLLEAFRHVRARRPDARLVVVGPPPAWARVPGVEFLGWVHDPKVLSRLYTEAHVFTLPSLCEPFAQTFMEAMGFALPCVGTDTGGVPEIVEDGVTGFVVPRGEAKALAERLIALLNDVELSRRLGAAGREKVVTSLNWPAAFRRMHEGMLQVLREGAA